MYKILEKTPLNPTVTKMVIEAPLVAKKAEPGQFIIFRASEDGERVPLTIADYDRKAGTVTIIFQIVGGATMELNALNAGDSLVDFVGPLGTPSKLEGLKKVAVVGGGVGCAIAYPTAKKLHELGAEVHSVVGFRNKDLVILEKEFEAVSAQVVKMSDDGSWGEKGLVTNALETLIKRLYGEDAVVRFRPHHFPFTEPSCEVDMQCFKCHGTGETAGQVCSTCHGEGWIELLGAGMVHPKVLEGCGIDPKKYSGFAFGIGLERMAMGRLRINDLRLIFDNDVRFLSQF